MDRWRDFFAQAGADLWTIIDQAIKIAASDFPREFRDKRCDIAETLFARRLLLQGHTEATRLSGSVITSATANDEKGAAHFCRQEVHRPRHVHGHDEAEVDRHVHGDEHDEAKVDRRLHDHCHDRAEAGLDGHLEVDTHAHDHNDTKTVLNVHKNVSNIKEKLTDANQSEVEILDSLRALEHLQVDVKILKATEIGKQVNNFRKHPSGQVRFHVKRLVRTWKDLVDEWVKTAGDVPALDATRGCGTLERNVREQEIYSTPLSESVLLSTKTTPMHMPQLQLHKCTDDERNCGGAICQENFSHLHACKGNLPGGCREIDSRETKICNDQDVPEEMGSSRVECDELGRIGRLGKGPELNRRAPNNQTPKDQRYTAHLSRCSVTKSIIGGLGSGKPVTDIPEVKGNNNNGNSVSEHPKNAVEKARRTHDIQGDMSQKDGHPKTSNVPKSSIANETQAAERLEVAKRKLYKGYQQVENAKKQRTIQLVDRPSLPKGGCL